MNLSRSTDLNGLQYSPGLQVPVGQESHSGVVEGWARVVDVASTRVHSMNSLIMDLLVRL